MIAVAHRSGPQGGHVGAARGLGDGEGSNFVPAQHAGDDALLEFGRAVVQDRWQADGVRIERGRDAAAAAARKLFGCHQVVEDIDRRAAEFLRVTQARDAEFGGALVERAREGAGFVPLVDEGRDLACDELAQRAAELLVFGREIVGQGLKVKHGEWASRL